MWDTEDKTRFPNSGVGPTFQPKLVVKIRTFTLPGRAAIIVPLKYILKSKLAEAGLNGRYVQTTFSSQRAHSGNFNAILVINSTIFFPP